MATHLQKLEPVLEAIVAAEENATLAPQKQSNGAVGATIQPLHLLHIHQLDLERDRKKEKNTDNANWLDNQVKGYVNVFPLNV